MTQTDDLQQKEEAEEEDGQPEKVMEDGATEVCRWNSPTWNQQEAAMAWVE